MNHPKMFFSEQFYQLFSTPEINKLTTHFLSQFHRNSFHQHISFQKNRVYVHIHYFLSLEVKVSGLFTNFHIDIPIRIGTKPQPNLNQPTTISPLRIIYFADVHQSTFNDDGDPPPSYESVMQNLQ